MIKKKQINWDMKNLMTKDEAQEINWKNEENQEEFEEIINSGEFGDVYFSEDDKYIAIYSQFGDSKMKDSFDFQIYENKDSLDKFPLLDISGDNTPAGEVFVKNHAKDIMGIEPSLKLNKST